MTKTHLEHTGEQGEPYYACNLAVNANSYYLSSSPTCKNCQRILQRLINLRKIKDLTKPDPHKIYCYECNQEIPTGKKDAHYILYDRRYHVPCFHVRVKQ